MSELSDLYGELIKDHKQKPRNFRALAHPTCSAQGHNPLCGDRFTVFLDVENDQIKDASFQGAGCAISTASGSLMTEALKGKSKGDAIALFDAFHDLVTGERAKPDAVALGKLEAFEGVRAFPMRVKCATLAWHAMKSALAGGGTATTE